jgi:hypothetical protein
MIPGTCPISEQIPSSQQPVGLALCQVPYYLLKRLQTLAGCVRLALPEQITQRRSNNDAKKGYVQPHGAG